MSSYLDIDLCTVGVRACKLSILLYLFHVLTLVAFLCLYLVWSGCELGGHSMFFISMFCVSMCWLGMVLNQGQLSIVVSDKESYLGSLFCHLRLWDVVFVSSV
jgi:hypothetical protein